MSYMRTFNEFLNMNTTKEETWVTAERKEPLNKGLCNCAHSQQMAVFNDKGLKWDSCWQRSSVFSWLGLLRGRYEADLNDWHPHWSVFGCCKALHCKRLRINLIVHVGDYLVFYCFCFILNKMEKKGSTHGTTVNRIWLKFNITYIVN